MMMTTKMKCALFVNQLLRGVRLVSNIRVMNRLLSLENGECSQEREIGYIIGHSYLLFAVTLSCCISMFMFLTLKHPYLSMDMFSKHAFHLQCVSTWLQSQNSNNPTCPTCRQEWEFGAERTVVDDDAEGEESVDV